MRRRARSLRRKNSPRPSQPQEKRELCCTKEREAGKILSSMSPGTKATTISRSGSKRLGAHVREPCGARRDVEYPNPSRLQKCHHTPRVAYLRQRARHQNPVIVGEHSVQAFPIAIDQIPPHLRPRPSLDRRKSTPPVWFRLRRLRLSALVAATTVVPRSHGEHSIST